MLYRKIVLLLGVICLGLCSCSDDDNQEKKLVKADLVGTAWNVDQYKVVFRDGEYQLEKLPGKRHLVFYEGYLEVRNTSSDFPEIESSATWQYSIEGDILTLGGDPYKIARYTGSVIELIDLFGINRDIARKSGFGFQFKEILRKV